VPIFVGTHPELFSAELDDSPVDRTFGSPTILTWTRRGRRSSAAGSSAPRAASTCSS